MVSWAKRGAGMIRTLRLRLEKARFPRLYSAALLGLVVLVAALLLGIAYEMLSHLHYHGMTLLYFITSQLSSREPVRIDGSVEDFPRSPFVSTSGDVTSAGSDDLKKLSAIRGMMMHAWDSYAKYAWGQDELRPISKTGHATFGGCTAITILDAADTLFIMGLKDRFSAAQQWIFKSLDFSCVRSSQSAFETTIRSLGGLMTLYHLTGNPRYLAHAEDLGSRLRHQFDENGMVPKSSCVLAQSKCSGSYTNIAEAGTLQMEWRALGDATEKADLKTGRVRAERVMLAMVRSLDRSKVPGSTLYDSDTPGKVEFRNEVSMAGNSDSFFEYLLKVHLQGGSSTAEKHYRDAFEDMMRATFKTLIKSDGGMMRVIHNAPTRDVMDHLACFLPGSLALAANSKGSSLSEEERKKFMEVAAGLTETCYNMYHMSPSGLAPEQLHWSGSDMIGPAARYNIQRPEAVEAIFYMWRFTKDPKYREWNWEIYQAFERVLRVEGGYASLKNAWAKEPTKDDSMSSFFLAETLKYLYLTFTNDTVVSLDEWVFNTEAHPLRISPSLSESAVPFEA